MGRFDDIVESTGRARLDGDVASAGVDAYDPPSGPENSQSRTSRVEIVNKAKQLMLDLTEPAEVSQQHVVNMMELVAIRTLLSLKVLPKIPEHGSVSLHNLSQATGVQKSLLGNILRKRHHLLCMKGERLLRLLVGTKFLDQVSDEQGKEILVDVGGGTGHAIAKILGKHPQLAKKPDRFVLQDLRDVVELAGREGGLTIVKVWRPGYGHAGLIEAKLAGGGDQ